MRWVMRIAKNTWRILLHKLGDNMLGNKIIKSTLFAGLLTLAGLTLSLEASAACQLVSNNGGGPLTVKVDAADTPEAKTFLETCINPYTKMYAKDPEAAKAGRKVYTYNGCSGCHGGKLEGVMAPSLRKDGGQGAYDTKWAYAKHTTDKGMFETIAGGGANPGISSAVMPTWHKQVEGHAGDGLTTDEILKAIAYIRTQYHGDDKKDWLN
jgi:cytochrome c-L